MTDPLPGPRAPAAVRESLPRRLVSWMRDQVWGLSVTLVCGLTYALLLVADGVWAPRRVDDYYIYLFARSLAFDFDIDFTNDYAICGDPGHHGHDFGTGHPANYWYSGPAIVLSPLLWLARLIVPVARGASDKVLAGCTGPYLDFVMAFGPVIGAAAVYLGYRAARRFAEDVDAGLAAALVGFGTPLIAYASAYPMFSHVYTALYAGVIVVASCRAAEKPSSIARWVVAAASLLPVVLTRPPSAVYGLVPLLLAVQQRRSVSRIRLGVIFGVIGLFGLVAVGLTLLQYKYLFGGYLENPHGRYYMHLGHAHPWLLLFGIKGGLFYHSPVVWLAVVGLYFAWKRRRESWALVASLLFCAAVEVYTYSANLGWHSYGTYGARKLTGLTPLFAISIALAAGALRTFLLARPARLVAALYLAVIIPVAFTFFGVVYGVKKHAIRVTVSESQAGFFGDGVRHAWAALDEHVGPVFVYPAALIFAWRYGLSPTAFRAATDPGEWYVRSFRSLPLKYVHNTIKLDDEKLSETIRGGQQTRKGLRIPSGEVGRVVFTAEWPIATQLTLSGEGGPGCVLEVGRGGWFRDTWYGAAPLPKRAEVTYAIPEGGFDSGIMELLFRVGGVGCTVVVEEILLEDETVYEAPYTAQREGTFKRAPRSHRRRSKRPQRSKPKPSPGVKQKKKKD